MAKPLALVVAGALAGVVSLPTTRSPTFPVDVERPDAPVQQIVEAAERSAAGTWAAMAAGDLSPRERVVSAWTGSELLVWGGRVAQRGTWFGDGAAYDPQTDRWRRLPPSPLRARAGAIGVWTGEELVIWGGAGALAEPGTQPRPRAREVAGQTEAFADGAAYNPRTDRWRRLPDAPLSARRESVGVWTGREVVVWGGYSVGEAQHRTDGARYNPATNRWHRMRRGPLTSERIAVVRAAALDGRVLVWASSFTESSEVLYDPRTDRWRRIGRVLIQPGIVPAMATVAGSVLLWGRWRLGDSRPLAARYTTATDRWITVTQPPYAPVPGQPVVAAESAAVAWQAGGGLLFDGLANRWIPLPPGPVLRRDAIPTWAGDRLLVWSPGGELGGLRAAVWIRGNAFQALPPAPAAIDAGGAAVWTGWLEGDQQLILWGGLDSGAADVGASYDPQLGLWEALPSAPLTRRVRPAAAWTGEEMAVVGGSDLPDAPGLRDGAAYDPGRREWRRLPDAPFGVVAGAMSWGNARLYAGGVDRGAAVIAEYDPATDRWQDLPAPPLPADIDRVHVMWTNFEVWVWATRTQGDGAGAAWDPRDHRWRRLPALAGVPGRLVATWAGARMFVLAADGTTASLGRGGAEWRRYARSPVRSTGAATVWNGQALLAFDAERRQLGALDPRASTWTDELPPPLPRAIAGQLVWTGRDLLALAGGSAAMLSRTE